MNTLIQLHCPTPVESMLKTIVSPTSRQLESPQVGYNQTLHKQNVKKGWCSCGCTDCDDPTVPHDYFEAVLDYIKDMLMGEEDDLMNKSSMYHDCSALQATEKSFYDVLAQKQVNFPSSINALDLNFSKTQRPESQFGSLRGKKNRQSLECGGFEEHGRSNKQLAGGRGEEMMEGDIVTMIDKLLLCPGSKQVGLHDELACCPFDKPTNPVNNGKQRRKRTDDKKEIVDLKILLTQCAQAVSSNNKYEVEKFLKKIRSHSSPRGDSDERLAHYFANALEARFQGTGMDLYANIASSKINSSDIVKAYQVYVSTCPFKKMSNIYANKMIGNLARGSPKLHIIDFGILYGFQWPCLIQGLSARPGGPPSLKITGIDFPQPGFRPAERVEETGRRLADYCKRFNVPFEYHAIAKQWDTVTMDNLKIDKDEILVANCLYRLRNVPDETVLGAIDCPRESVLKLIKTIKPDLFIHGIVNGNYNAPFFLTRFREAYFNFSVLFDMFEAALHREDEERLLFEKEVIGREVINVIACEGTKRIERPETYKQWQARNERAGFTAVPMNKGIMKEVKAKVKIGFHKDFMVDNDGDWMVQGWKGRVIYAISSWKIA
ncbi:transcription factor GRAS [Artemisia annua]|uniref:Transcription factor GRAS n=1 Tax=Artemisia annua TaxID=35608 RepID=A0A2U1MZM3_ARTAN|nr:transcription factor GRAS [Artemisia annua]